mgnify:CR=1 FL=1
MPIYLRITVNGKRAEPTSGRECLLTNVCALYQIIITVNTPKTFYWKTGLVIAHIEWQPSYKYLITINVDNIKMGLLYASFTTG